MKLYNWQRNCNIKTWVSKGTVWMFFICSFSFGQCVVCSWMYGLLLSLWYLQTLLVTSLLSRSDNRYSWRYRGIIILYQTLLSNVYKFYWKIYKILDRRWRTLNKKYFNNRIMYCQETFCSYVLPVLYLFLSICFFVNVHYKLLYISNWFWQISWWERTL